MKIRYYLSFLLFLIAFTARAQKYTAFYVAAHPDDWQLFMNPNAYKDVKNPNSKVVFVHTTAGDAGRAMGYNNYYLAREKGSLRSIRFMSNAFTSGQDLGTNMNKTIANINGHPILKYSYRNIVAYFLRLPDGFRNGAGIKSTGNVSLQKLYNGDIPSISAIDNTTTYTSMEDLSNTIQSLVEFEAKGSESISFNSADDDPSINPNDHSDHVYSSKFFQHVAKKIGNIVLYLYSDYDTETRAKNICDDDFLINTGTWAVASSELSDNFHNSTWDNVHNAWVSRQYYRTVIIPKAGQTHNIALHKPTTASSSQLNNSSDNANDNNYFVNKNYWGADPYPQWWQVDLENIYNVTKIVVINYYDGKRYYRYDIEASLDGEEWTKVVDFNANTTAANSKGNTFKTVNTKARYLRVNMNFNSANKGVQIVEFEAYGNLLCNPEQEQ